MVSGQCRCTARSLKFLSQPYAGFFVSEQLFALKQMSRYQKYLEPAYHDIHLLETARIASQFYSICAIAMWPWITWI